MATKTKTVETPVETTPAPTRIAISKVEKRLNALDTPFKRKGSAAVLAVTADGQVWMHRLRHTNYEYISRFVAMVERNGSIDPAFWVRLDTSLMEEFNALVDVVGTIYQRGTMPTLSEASEDPDATPQVNSDLPKVDRVKSGMGYHL